MLLGQGSIFVPGLGKHWGSRECRGKRHKPTHCTIMPRWCASVTCFAKTKQSTERRARLCATNPLHYAKWCHAPPSVLLGSMVPSTLFLTPLLIYYQHIHQILKNKKSFIAIEENKLEASSLGELALLVQLLWNKKHPTNHLKPLLLVNSCLPSPPAHRKTILIPIYLYFLSRYCLYNTLYGE